MSDVSPENNLSPENSLNPEKMAKAQLAAAKAHAKALKPWYKKWWVWLLALVVVIVIISVATSGGGDSTSPSSSPSAAVKKDKLTLDDGWTMDKNSFATYVNGYVSNNTDKAITNYVDITFDALDKDGANVGTCLANTNTIDAKGKWKFKAMCLGDGVETVRFKKISGF